MLKASNCSQVIDAESNLLISILPFCFGYQNPGSPNPGHSSSYKIGTEQNDPGLGLRRFVI